MSAIFVECDGSEAISLSLRGRSAPNLISVFLERTLSCAAESTWPALQDGYQLFVGESYSEDELGSIG